MRCPKCHCIEDKVVDSRMTKEGAEVRRRRECLNCGYRFTTYEAIIQGELKVIKNNNIREDFNREKIRQGIEKACWKRPIRKDEIDIMVERIVTKIESEYDNEVPTRDIGDIVMKEMRTLDEVAYVRFASVYRHFKDIEEFIQEIKSLK